MTEVNLNEIETTEGSLNEVKMGKRGSEGCEDGKKENVDLENNSSDKQVDGNVEVRNESCPRVGMDFKSQEEAYEFYCSYALKTGFRVRKCTTSRSRRRRACEVIGRNYVCSRQGVKDPRTESLDCKKRNRVEYRTGCKAYISLRKRNENMWVVTKFLDEHNHEMESSSKRKKLHSLKKIGDKEKILQNMCLAGVKINPMKNDVAPEAGGSSNVVSIKWDGRNVLTPKRQTELKKEDVEIILSYLEKQQMENPSFLYSIQVDSEGQMTNFFWTDAKSRMDYLYFGDVVCFDSACKTNWSEFPFIPILGINHHCQIALFGSALLYNESEESFQWLIRTWMKAMNGKEPKVVLTDYDSAIGEVVKRVLPSSCHRCCSYEIIHNAKKILADVIDVHEGFVHDFTDCLNNCETMGELESSWGTMLEKYGLGNNKWVMELFKKQGEWSSVYARDIFLPSMFTNQNTESIFIYFGDCLKGDIPLCEFFKQFENSVIDKREKEYLADFESNYTVPALRFSIDIEKDAAKVYTKEIFQKFQDQLFKGISYRHKKVAESGNTSTYSVWKTGLEEKVRSVALDYSSMSAKCSCQLFESAGYLCRHILKIFLVENVHNLLSQYILKRWTKDAKSGSVVDDLGEIVQPNSCEDVTVENVTGRYSNLCQEAINIAAKGSASVEAYKVALQCLHNTVKEIEAALKLSTGSVASNITVGSQNKDNTVHGQLEKSSEDQTSPLVPCSIRHRGRPRVWKQQSDKLPVKKMSTTQKAQNQSQNIVSSQISFAITNEIPHESQQERRKVGKSLHSTVAVENNKFERSILPAGQNRMEDHQPEDLFSHLYLQPSAREFEFRTLSHASPATIGQDTSHLSQSYYMNNVQPFSLICPTQQLHCLSQDSSVVGQTSSMTQHNALASNNSYLKRSQFGQGTAPTFVLRPPQLRGSNSFDLNDPNRDSS
ncbi:Far1-related sequence 5-like [Thalictrum thalictroides]|uniref:Protein FAR1-RELATED SEQUENCE n=1 Tax=Thalictrum thalictroides TaxID=46969 RepID=A0A7J6VHM5_THATH|nr:Far1-related sequence 5-like [Thalictrum thalictroides]